MSQGNIDAILSGSYVWAIQDALGGAGAWTRISISPDDASTATSSAAPAPSVILSLSPLAQKIAAGSEIALQVIDAASPSRTSAVRSAEARGAAADPDAASAQGSGPDTSSAVQEAKDAAKTALTDPQAAFDALVTQSGGAATWSQWLGDDAQRHDFVAAFDSGDLTTDSAASVEGLGYTDSTTLTGISESVSIAFNQKWETDADAANDTYSFVCSFPGIGGIYVTFPKAASGAAGVTTES